MRVGLLSQWFSPETGPASIPGVLARGLVARGHEVVVLTGYPNYPTGSLYDGYRMRLREDSVEDGFELRRVALYPDHSTRTRDRLINYGSFAMNAAAFGTSALKGIDVLWVYNSPATIALPMWLAKARFRVPIVLHNMDMWPDSVIHAGFAPRYGAKVMLSALDRWVNGMYRTADRVAYISPAAGQELRRRGVPAEKLRYAPVWVDNTIYRPTEGTSLRLELGFNETDIVIGYAGALGRAQCVVELAEAVAGLPIDSAVRCLILGAGTEANRLEDLAKTHPSRISFIGHVPHSAMTDYSAVPDISFVGLSPGPQAAFAAPSKVNAILACGKPLMAATGGDTDDLIKRTGVGISVPPGDTRALSLAIRDLDRIGRGGLASKGEQALKLSQRELSTEAGIQRIESILAECATLNHSGSSRLARVFHGGSG